MKKVFVLLLFFRLLSANWESLFIGEDDPTFFHHVHVLSGNLHAHFEDAIVKGAVPLLSVRTYSSSGAQEVSKQNLDLGLKKLRKGFLIQEGWNLFPHTDLLVHAITIGSAMIKIREPSGHITTYMPLEIKNKYRIIYAANNVSTYGFAKQSGRERAQNNILDFNAKKGEAILYLANGGRRIYRGENFYKKQFTHTYYHLNSEILPSGHVIEYSYTDDKSHKLSFVALKNPSKTKIFSWIQFMYLEDNLFIISTSDGKSSTYKLMTWKGRDYIEKVTHSSHPEEKLLYKKPRKGIGLALKNILFDGKEQWKVSYLKPRNKKEASEWKKYPASKHFAADRVSKISVLLDGSHVSLASFDYTPGWTDARDVHGTLTRFHYQGNSLTSIEYFDKDNIPRSHQKIIWDSDKLISRMMCDSNGNPIFAKTFRYDSFGNVLEERLEGNLSGAVVTPFFYTNKGNLIEAESHAKYYTYQTGTHLLEKETEDRGLTIHYHYKNNTDLVTSKLTSDGTTIQIREFFFYNDDNLLIEQIIDDGDSYDPYSLHRITERKIKRYTLDSDTGMPTQIAEYYLEEGTEKLLKKSIFTYSTYKQVIQEDVYDSLDQLRYSLYTDYDRYGHVIRKTTPLCREATYIYDSHNHLLSSNESSFRKEYEYNGLGLLTSCRDVETGKTTYTKYDNKGQILSTIDSFGNTLSYTYDSFGRCLSLTKPEVEDENGLLYHPCTTYTYDPVGNVIQETHSLNQTIKKTYNAFNKETSVTAPDGSKITHIYHTNGTLKKTMLPDGTETEYTYDPFQRVTQKKISHSGLLLSSENWIYNAFHLTSHTDPNGLTTRYIYDGAGRLILQAKEDRTVSYAYDSLGFLEKTTKGEVSHIQIHDIEGRIVEEWQENLLGKIENKMRFIYNDKNQKIKAYRITSQGEAVDSFTYDTEGRLTTHTNPENQVTSITYLDNYKQKITTDPLQNQTIETFNALGQTTRLEKKDSLGRIVSSEALFYNKAHQKTRYVLTRYLKATPLEQIETKWEYDSLGHITKIIEAEGKITTFTYDIRGFIKDKILPNGIIFSHVYDPLGRILELKSSDDTIHYTYTYASSPLPILISDHIQNTTLKRSYNLFLELVEETTPSNLTYKWCYNSSGKLTQFVLPNESSIEYSYEGGHMKQVRRYNSKQSLLYEHTYSSFDENGHVQEEHFISDLGIQINKRDLLERPLSTHSPWVEQSLTYGPSGLIMEKKNSLFGDVTYVYDPLTQLIQEGPKTYLFDSAGNPGDAKINALHQIVATDTEEFSYDLNGNPYVRTSSSGTTLYTYDALNRLTDITYPDKTSIHYSYDPLSRLVSKQTDLETRFYLYNQDYEIGTITKTGTPLDLKILGLGIQGDIGAAIAIEIGTTLYAPLHDFSGNIIALIGINGEIDTTYPLDAFGKNTLFNNPNPWQFASKRCEGTLIFFGKRFYDPSVCRFLTPDPIGAVDGQNLYLYVLNNPLSRLDLFGLSQYPIDAPGNHIFIDINFETGPFAHSSERYRPLWTTLWIDGSPYPSVISSGSFHNIRFTPQEKAQNFIDIFDHIHELIPQSGEQIGIAISLNGICNKPSHVHTMHGRIWSQLPKELTTLALYNESHSLLFDGMRVFCEKILKIDTPIVIATRSLLSALSSKMSETNPDASLFLYNHSEGGAISELAISGMTGDEQKNLYKHLVAFGAGPASPLPKKYAKNNLDVYSNKDHVTLPFAKPYLNDPNYNIQVLECVSSSREMNLIAGDHGHWNTTYRKALQKHLEEMENNYGFYRGHNENNTR